LLPLLLAAALATAGDAQVAARLDSALQVEARQGFSGVVLVAHEDTIQFERAYGKAAAAATAAAVPPGRLAFWIASDSKQFTATSILRLQELGRLRVTDSIAQHLPGVPPDKRAVTIHQLLTHTSGLPTAYRADGVVERDAAVASILRLPLASTPGTRFSYSNDGFVLLAAIVEIASGVHFDDFERDSLFARAGLTETGLWGSEAAGVALAPFADPRQARGKSATIYRDGHSVANWGYRGPGGAYSTARDLVRWIVALRQGRVLGADAMHALLGRHVLVHADSSGQSWTGYGWGVRVEGGRDRSYGHVGGEDWIGHSAVVRFSPEGDIVVVLANSGDHGDEGWAATANRAVRHVLDPGWRP